MGCELLHREYVSLSDDCELNCIALDGFLHLHHMFEDEAEMLRIFLSFSLYVRMNLNVPSCEIRSDMKVLLTSWTIYMASRKTCKNYTHVCSLRMRRPGP